MLKCRTEQRLQKVSEGCFSTALFAPLTFSSPFIFTAICFEKPWLFLPSSRPWVPLFVLWLFSSPTQFLLPGGPLFHLLQSLLFERLPSLNTNTMNILCTWLWAIKVHRPPCFGDLRIWGILLNGDCNSDIPHSIFRVISTGPCNITGDNLGSLWGEWKLECYSWASCSASVTHLTSTYYTSAVKWECAGMERNMGIMKSCSGAWWISAGLLKTVCKGA